MMYVYDLPYADSDNDPLNKTDPLGLRPSGPNTVACLNPDGCDWPTELSVPVPSPVITCGGVDFFADDVIYQKYGETGWDLAIRLLLDGLGGGLSAASSPSALRPVYSAVGGDGPGDRGYLCPTDFLGRVPPPIRLPEFIELTGPCHAVGLAQHTANAAAGILSVISLGHADEITGVTGGGYCSSSAWYTGGNVLGWAVVAFGGAVVTGAEGTAGGFTGAMSWASNTSTTWSFAALAEEMLLTGTVSTCTALNALASGAYVPGSGPAGELGVSELWNLFSLISSGAANTCG